MLSYQFAIRAWTRRFVVVALWAGQPAFLVRANAQSVLEEPRAAADADDGKTEANPRGQHAADPELIALTWQYRPQASQQRIRQPVWRADGVRLTAEETDALLNEVKSFQTHWWQPEQLTPLVLVFRRDGEITTGLSPAIVLESGRRLWSGTWGPFSPNGFATSACAPQSRDLAKWPEMIDIAVKVPLEAPQTIKTVRPMPDHPVEVAPGVRWYIDPDRGMDRRGGQRRAHLPAAVFEVENESPDTLVSFDAIAWLRDNDETPLRGSYATIIERRPNVRATVRISEPLDDVNAIEKVEFTRQRFKIERFDRVKLRVDLLLPLGDNPDQPDAAPNPKQVIREDK